jgi:hypothetical protein
MVSGISGHGKGNSGMYVRAVISWKQHIWLLQLWFEEADAVQA